MNNRTTLQARAIYQTSFRKIALNSSSISKKIMLIYNQNTLLQILKQNTAYYLQIKLGFLHKRYKNVPFMFPTRRSKNFRIRNRPEFRGNPNLCDETRPIATKWSGVQGNRGGGNGQISHDFWPIKKECRTIPGKLMFSLTVVPASFIYCRTIKRIDTPYPIAL